MAISHTLSFSVATSSGTVSQSQSVSSDGEINSDFSATGSATTEVNIVFTTASLKSIFILSDGALTLKTNSSGAPDDTISIAASTPFVWTSTSGVTCPFTANVTNTYWTNASATARSVNVRIIKDVTP